MKKSQLEFLKRCSANYGGSLLTKRKFRLSARPVSTKHSMHFVLRSTQAKGDWSFLRHKNKIRSILDKFAHKYGVKLNSLANVGNHLHIHLQLTNRHTYKAFVRAITSAIMMAVKQTSRWKPFRGANSKSTTKKFWDLRPYSRIIIGFKARLTIEDYIAINNLEANGYSREQARFIISWDRGK